MENIKNALDLLYTQKDLHLEYLFCCQYTENDKILDLLEDLATKKKKCSLNPRLSDKYCDNYKLLFHDVLKLFKIKDSPKQPHFLIPIKTWSSIRKKTIKDLIRLNFVLAVKEQHNFDDKTLKRLNRDIVIGIGLKNINDNNIVIEANKIVRIEGLILETNSFRWADGFDVHLYNETKKKITSNTVQARSSAQPTKRECSEIVS